jgi:hypothetical protein
MAQGGEELKLLGILMDVLVLSNGSYCVEIRVYSFTLRTLTLYVSCSYRNEGVHGHLLSPSPTRFSLIPSLSSPTPFCSTPASLRPSPRRLQGRLISPDPTPTSRATIGSGRPQSVSGVRLMATGGREERPGHRREEREAFLDVVSSNFLISCW